jgi:hypothetical protein
MKERKKKEAILLPVMRATLPFSFAIVWDIPDQQTKARKVFNKKRKNKINRCHKTFLPPLSIYVRSKRDIFPQAFASMSN